MTKETAMAAFDLSHESWEGKEHYSKIYDGVYTVNEPHYPGGFKSFGQINNRGFLYQVVTDDLGPHYLMSGIPGPECIPKVKKLEEDTDTYLKVVVTSGDFHHMAMKFWMDNFPEVRFVHSALKFPNTRNGSSIMNDDKYKGRVELVDGKDFGSLKKYSETLQFFGFTECLVYADKEFMSADSKNTTKQGTFSYLKNFASTPADTRFLCIWTYHVPTKTLVFEHNFQMFLHKELKAQHMTMMGKMAMPTESFGSVGKGPMPTCPATEDSCRTHCEQMAAVAKLDVRNMLEYHSMCGKHVRQWKTREEFEKEFLKTLAATGEDDPKGNALFEYMNAKGCGCC